MKARAKTGSEIDAIFRDLAEVEVWKRTGRDRGVRAPGWLYQGRVPAELFDPDRC